MLGDAWSVTPFDESGAGVSDGAGTAGMALAATAATGDGVSVIDLESDEDEAAKARRVGAVLLRVAVGAVLRVASTEV